MKNGKVEIPANSEQREDVSLAGRYSFPFYFGPAWVLSGVVGDYFAMRREEREAARHVAPVPRDPIGDPRNRQERLLDAGLEETFPASDPVAVMRIT